MQAPEKLRKPPTKVVWTILFISLPLQAALASTRPMRRLSPTVADAHVLYSVRASIVPSFDAQTHIRASMIILNFFV